MILHIKLMNWQRARVILYTLTVKNTETEMSSGPGKSAGVVGPSGETLTLENLPAADTTRRWTMQRKAQVITAIRGSLITKEEACERCGISAEELSSWETLLDQHGLNALRSTTLQKYRGATDRAANGSDDPEVDSAVQA